MPELLPLLDRRGLLHHRIDPRKQFVLDHRSATSLALAEGREGYESRNDLTAKPASSSRMSLAIITDPGQANAFGTLHGGVLLRLADECGAIVALRHAGGGGITTAAID